MLKVSILSSYTVDLIVGEIKKSFNNPNIEWHIAPFNTYIQEILDDNSNTSKLKPDIIFILVDGETQIKEGGKFFDILNVVSQKFSASRIIVHNAFGIEPKTLKFLEWNTLESKRVKLARHNVALSEFSYSKPNINILDIASIVETYGKETLLDFRYWYISKNFWSITGIKKVAEQMASAVQMLTSRQKKCLVLDLDNTLWGGIIGEDGIEGIKLSNDGLGKAFYDFQKQIIRLYEHGIILAICSKNEEEVALKCIKEHPYCLLKENHFAAVKINWNDKASNIREIAKELNIGLDSMVFLDDSEHERDLVKSVLPEVEVPDLPKEFAHYPSFLSNLNYFEIFSVTDEDKIRGQLYANEKERTQLKNQFNSLQEYLESLDIKLKIQQADAFMIPRISQLTQRTNQFNFSTKRYTEEQIREMSQDKNFCVFGIDASDNKGQLGLVGVAILKLNKDNDAFLDTFLMSCRVLGRGIEEAFLADIAEQLKQKNISLIKTEYIETPKNKPVKDFIDKCGFREKDNYYEISAEISSKLHPTWIKRRENNA